MTERIPPQYCSNCKVVRMDQPTFAQESYGFRCTNCGYRLIYAATAALPSAMRDGE